MRIGLTYELKKDYPFAAGDPPDANSELLSWCEEHELIEGLCDAGHDVIAIGDSTHLLERLDYWRSQCDLVFNRSVGYRGIERKSLVAAILDAAGIPYIGSTPYVLSLTRNKYHTKLVLSAAGVLTPPAALLFGNLPHTLDRVLFPAIVKPVAESSSIGIENGASVVDSPEAALARAEVLYQRYAQPVLVESFIAGVEVEVPMLVDPEPRALGVLAIAIDGILPAPSYYLASDTIYNDNYSFCDPPATVDVEHISHMAMTAARALGIRDYGRLDFRVSTDGTPWLIEASTHPHIQRLSSFFAIAQRNGHTYANMLDELVHIAATRNGLIYSL